MSPEKPTSRPTVKPTAQPTTSPAQEVKKQSVRDKYNKPLESKERNNEKRALSHKEIKSIENAFGVKIKFTDKSGEIGLKQYYEFDVTQNGKKLLDTIRIMDSEGTTTVKQQIKSIVSFITDAKIQQLSR